MRYLVTLFLLFSSLFSEYLHNYEDILNQAKETGKIPAIMMSSSTCPWCERMKEKTLTDPELKIILEKYFVFGILEQDFDEFPESLRVRYTPTTHFMDQSGDVIWQSIGYKNRDSFLLDIYEVLNMQKTPITD